MLIYQTLYSLFKRGDSNMVTKSMTLLLLILLTGLTACTSTNQRTGQSQVRQVPDEATMTQQEPYPTNQGSSTTGTITTDTTGAGAESTADMNTSTNTTNSGSTSGMGTTHTTSTGRTETGHNP
jgi:hypothetical protein